MRRRAAIPAFVLAAVTGAVLLPLMFGPMWRDEGTTYLHAGQHSIAAALQSVRMGELAPPLYFVFEYLWVRAAGSSEFALRFPSLLAVAAAVGFLYDAARRVSGRLAAYATAACAMMAPLSLLVGTEARPYALTLLLASVVLWLVAWLLFDEQDRVVPVAVILGAAVAALCWTHYTAWPVVVGLALATPAIGWGTTSGRRTPYLLAVLAGGSTTIALLRDFTSAAGASVAISPDIATSNLWQRLDARFVWFNPLLIAEPVFVVLLLAATAAWLLHVARSWPATRLSAENQFLTACFCVVACGVGASVIRSAPGFHHLAAYAPAAWLIVGNFYARGASWLRMGGDIRTSSAGRKAGLAALAVIAILTISAFPLTWLNERTPRSGSRALVRELRHRAGNDVVLIAAPDALSPSLKYYLGDDPATRLQGIPTWSTPWYYGYVRDIDAVQKHRLLRRVDDEVRRCSRVAFAVDWNWKGFAGISYDAARDIVREESARHGVAFHHVFPGTVETMDLVLLTPACRRSSNAPAIHKPEPRSLMSSSESNLRLREKKSLAAIV